MPDNPVITSPDREAEPEGMESQRLLEQIEQLLERDDEKELRQLLDDEHAADLAEALEKIDPEDRQKFYRLTGGHLETGETYSYLPNDQFAEDIAELSPEVKARILGDLPDDELVDVFQYLDEEDREEVFQLLPEEKRIQAHNLLQYGEETAGGNMTTEIAAVRETMTVAEAKASLREVQERLEVVSRIFVVDKNYRLIGKVRLRDLTFAEDSTTISELNDHDTTSVLAEEDQEVAARLVAKYDLVALPVVNAQNVLLGIITHDDAVDILEAESTEDFEKIAAVQSSPSEMGYMETTVWRHFQRRIGWVVALAAVGLLSGYIIFSFENVLDRYFVLAIYMPVIVAAGGNTGGQAATLVIRAMALGEFYPREFFRVVIKELLIGLLIGTVLAALVALKIVFLSTEAEMKNAPNVWLILLTVSLSFVAQVITSTTIGALLPMTARALKLDPAVIASPAITTFVDVSGLLIYFGLAQLILGI